MKEVISKIQEKGAVQSLQIGFKKGKNNIRSLFNTILYKGTKQSNIMYAFYDLDVAAVSFDIVLFLVLAEQARINAECDLLHVVIVPASENKFKPSAIKSLQKAGYKNVYEHLEWGLRNVLVPCCWMIPSCTQVTVCASRDEARSFQAALSSHIFPKGSTIDNPRKRYLVKHVIESMKNSPLPSIHATPQAKLYINNWIKNNAGDKKVVTITLREYDLMPERNSSLKDWAKFAHSLDKNYYFPVILRDTGKDFTPLPVELKGLTIFHEAVWNVELRAALYELSYINMYVNNGPGCLLVMNKKTRYITIKLITESIVGTSTEYYKSMGMNYGESLPWATKFQKYVWEDDTYEVIKREFDEMCNKIEAH
jgi:hypothetical protein